MYLGKISKPFDGIITVQSTVRRHWIFNTSWWKIVAVIGNLYLSQEKKAAKYSKKNNSVISFSLSISNKPTAPA